jgi:hypothetical protein
MAELETDADAELGALIGVEAPNDFRSLSTFYLRVAAWCKAHDPIPERVVALVKTLREEDDDAPNLDRLVAWVAPSVQGMCDLAGWAHGRLRALDSGEIRFLNGTWDEATARRAQGAEPTDADQEVLKAILDPEQCWEFETFQLAFARNGAAALRACEEALRSPECVPVWRVILRTWLRRAREEVAA